MKYNGKETIILLDILFMALILLMMIGAPAYAVVPLSNADSSLNEALKLLNAEEHRKPDEERNTEKVLKAFDQVINSYPNTEAALTAKVMKASEILNQPGNKLVFEDALSSLRDIIKTAPNSWQSVLANILISLELCNKATGDEYSNISPTFEPSVTSASEFSLAKESLRLAIKGLPLITDKAWQPLKEFGGFPSKEELYACAHLLLGKTHLGLGDLVEANNEYQLVLLKFASTDAANIAVEYLDEIGIYADRKPSKEAYLTTRASASIKHYASAKKISSSSINGGAGLVLEDGGLRISFSSGSDVVEINGTRLKIAEKAQLVGGELNAPERFLNSCRRAILRRNAKDKFEKAVRMSKN